MDSERIVLHIPVSFTAEELAKYCKIKKNSSAFEAVEETVDLINEWAAPKAILKWANVDYVNEEEASINGTVFTSRIVAEKIKGLQRVFLSVVTEADSLERCEDLADDPLLDIYKGEVLHYATDALVKYMKDELEYDGSSMLNPGSLPDWPIEQNGALLELIGNAEEIGIRMSNTGYMSPWNSGSHIHFAGDGYQNCSLCKNYKCIGRRAAFDKAEYKRIFKIDP